MGSSTGQSSDNQETGDDHEPPSSEPRDCIRRLEELQSRLNSRDVDLNVLRESAELAEKNSAVNLEELGKVKGELAVCEQSLRRLEKTLENELSVRSRSASQLEAALEELSELRNSWLPLWASQRIQALCLAVGPRARSLITDFKMQYYKLRELWQEKGVPIMLQLASKTNQLTKASSLRVINQMRRAWEKNVPIQYRKTVSKGISRAQKASEFLRPRIERSIVVLNMQAVRTVDEIARLVEILSFVPPWAKENSHVVAMIVVGFPFVMIGFPLMSALVRKR